VVASIRHPLLVQLLHQLLNAILILICCHAFCFISGAGLQAQGSLKAAQQ
jgi:hypothetical protein